MTTKVQSNKNKTRKINKLRHIEYYEQQPLLDGLYAASAEGKNFGNLMPLILSDNNILLAYRSIKSNQGSMTPGTDNLTIEDIEKLEPNELTATVRKKLVNYQPKAVRRKDIPKPNGKTRPLGIPCILDRIIQQCILQILEPICEAKFSENSYGFRPLRSAENAIAAEMRLINQSKLHYVVEVDIKGFFDEVNHSKLMRQLWAIGIRDKKLLSIIKAILKAPIRMPDNTIYFPKKGTPQGGVLSPLLANIVLNELDHWIDSQWEEIPVVAKYIRKYNNNGSPQKGNGYAAIRNTRLKEMHIIRYADDVRILCATKSQANNTMVAVKQWLVERLKLQVSEEKTRVVNLKKQYSEFLGFKMKVTQRAPKSVVESHMCDKAINRAKETLKKQIKEIQHPANSGEQAIAICKYNAMVRGMHNYYEIATRVNTDFAKIAWEINHTIQNRLKKVISKKGTMGRKSQDYAKYGKSKQLRYIGTAWILPVAYIKTRNAQNKKRLTNIYTQEGRNLIHNELMISNKWIMSYMSEHPITNGSVEYNDNRISLFAAQCGKCAITNKNFLTPDEIHCHHKTPRSKGGSDKYDNLVLVNEEVHILIHATVEETVKRYMENLKLNPEQIKKINKLRELVGCEPI